MTRRDRRAGARAARCIVAGCALFHRKSETAIEDVS